MLEQVFYIILRNLGWEKTIFYKNEKVNIIWMFIINHFFSSITIYFLSNLILVNLLFNSLTLNFLQKKTARKLKLSKS